MNREETMHCSNCGSEVNGKFCTDCGTKAGDNSNAQVKQISSEKFRGKFTKVYREIDSIESKIHRQEGVFLKNHIYTQDELLNSKHHKKIFSITGKIGDDVKNWHMNGKLSEEARSAYYEERNETDDKLHQLKLEIESREPTWWESIKGSVGSFISLIMENIPELSGWLLTATTGVIKLLPTPVGRVVGGIASLVNKGYSKHKRLSQQE